jgi:hypothetical protein
MAAKLKQLSRRLPGSNWTPDWVQSGRLRVVVATALLTIATFAVAQEFRGSHPDTYVVKRGDTLWDIAGRFLKRPWLWPEIWQANPQIANPHLIYPGDVISLAYLNRLVSQPGPRTEAPINAIPLSQIEPFLKDLRVVDEFADLPYVVGLEDDRLRSAEDQLAYVRGMSTARVGDRVMVLRPLQRYSRLDRTQACCDRFHKTELDFRGERTLLTNSYWTDLGQWSTRKGKDFLGYELLRVNAGTITRGEVGGIEATTVLLDDADKEVRIGDRVVPVEAQSYDLQFFPHAPKQQLDYGRARVLAVADMMTSGGPRDVVALSVGAREGVDNGTVFSVWRVGSNAVDRVEYGMDRTEDSVSFRKKVRLPDEYASHVMIFRTFDKISYGLVMEGVKPTRMGYELKHPDATY